MAIKLHGKDYIEVKDRVIAAHAEDSYSMLSEETFEMGGRSYCRVYIDVKGKQYIGTAEIKFNANPKTPDGMSPLECGETSALGRALGFAGYGVVESIASADEVVRNQEEEPARTRDQALHDLAKPGPARAGKPLTNGDGSEAKPKPYSLDEVKAAFLKMFKPEKWEAFKVGVIGVQVDDAGLDDAELNRIYGKIVEIKRDKMTAATNAIMR